MCAIILKSVPELILLLSGMTILSQLRDIRILECKLAEHKRLRKLGEDAYMREQNAIHVFEKPEATWWGRFGIVCLTKFNWAIGRCRYDAINDRLYFTVKN